MSTGCFKRQLFANMSAISTLEGHDISSVFLINAALNLVSILISQQTAYFGLKTSIARFNLEPAYLPHL